MDLLPRVSCGLQNISVRLRAFFLRRSSLFTSLLAGIALCLGLGALGANAFAVAKPMVEAGDAHSLALKSDGTVVAWGDNAYGQATVPVGLANVVAVAAGGVHSLALKSDGTVVAWGRNDYGQTTVPAGLANVVAVSAGGWHSLALKSDGTVVAWGINSFSESTVPAGLGNVAAVAAGGQHSLALKSDGTVVVWGVNDYGQLTVPAGLANVVAVAGGSRHSLAVKSDGTVVAWGRNDYGQSTVPAALSNAMAAAAGEYHSLALKSDGTVVAWGSNGYGQSTVPAGLSNVIAVAAGAYFSLALKSDGTVVGWGTGQGTIPAGLNLGVSTLPATTTTSTTSTTTTTAIATITSTTIPIAGAVWLDLGTGWNLVSNVSGVPDMASSFGDAAKVSTVWKWLASKANWAFYSPMLGDGGASYASGKGYDFLTNVSGGEGFWVNAKIAFTAQLPFGNPYSPTGSLLWSSDSFRSMTPGWHLIAIQDRKTPSQFNRALSLTSPSSGVTPINLTTLWAWDNAASNWYFYAPSLEAQGGTALIDYTTSKGYLDFGTKVLEPTTGFWVNVPGDTASFSLSINNAGTGSGNVSVNPSAAAYASGTVVTLTAVPNSGSTFVGWSGACTGTTTTCAVTINANQSVTATFNVITTNYTLSIATSGTNLGSVTANPTGPTYASGTVVMLTATPNTGSTFTGWSGACTSTATTCTVTMDANKSVTATFNLVATTYTLSTATSGTGSGTVIANPAGPTYASGVLVTLTATANADSTFAGWSGACTGTATTCTLTMNANQSVTAIWQAQAPPSIQLSTLGAMTAMPFTSLTISGSGLTQATSGVSVRFIPENGNPAIIVPVSAPSSTTLKVMVPPLFDPTTGSSISGVVDVQVIQNSGTTLLTSNFIRGLRIDAVPPVPTGTPVGSRTAAFLNATLDIFDSTQSASSDPTLSQIATVSPNYRSDLGALISAINAITSSPGTSVGFAAADGSTIALDARGLALSDQVIQALVAELASKAQVPATVAKFDAMRNWLVARLEAILNWFIPSSLAQVSDECPLFPNDPVAYDTNLCHAKRIIRNLTPGEDPAVRAAVIDAGANLAAGMLFAPVSFAHHIIAGAVWTFSYALVKTGAPPPGGDVVEGMTTTTLDALANSNGLIGFAADAFKVFRLAATTFPSHKGVPPAMTVSDAAGNSYLLMRDGTKLVQVPTTQGSFPIDSLALVVRSTTTTSTATSTSTSTTTASTTTTTVLARECACAFDSYSKVFGPGGAWFCYNTTEGVVWPPEYLVTGGTCEAFGCGAAIYTVCQ